MQGQQNSRVTQLRQAEMVASARRERMLTGAAFEVRLQRVTPGRAAVR